MKKLLHIKVVFVTRKIIFCRVKGLPRICGIMNLIRGKQNFLGVNVLQIDASLPKDKRIMIAAEKVFSMRGYEKATLDEIIALADVGKGTVYKYFGNKERLFYKLVSDRNASFVEELHRVVGAAQGVEDKLIAYFEIMVAFYRTNSALWQIIYFEMFNESQCTIVLDGKGEPQVVSRYGNEDVDPDLKECYLRYHYLLASEFNILRDIIEQGINSKVLKPSNAHISGSHLFFGIAMGVFHHIHTLESRLSNRDISKLIVDRFLYGEIRR